MTKGRQFNNLLERRHTNIRSSTRISRRWLPLLLCNFFNNFVSLSLSRNLVPFDSKLSDEHDLFVFNDSGPIAPSSLFPCIKPKIEAKDGCAQMRALYAHKCKSDICFWLRCIFVFVFSFSFSLRASHQWAQASFTARMRVHCIINGVSEIDYTAVCWWKSNIL